MNKLFELGNQYAKESDWKDFALMIKKILSIAFLTEAVYNIRDGTKLSLLAQKRQNFRIKM